MTPVQQWLHANAFGYVELTAGEREAINEFCLLWSLFEERVLDNDGSVHRIKAKVVEAQNRLAGLDTAAFQDALSYFSDRYFDGDSFNERFEGLRFQGKNSGRDEVEAVLSGSEQSGAAVLTALLIVVYRLRNNLLHGEKWSYGLKDQLGNFTNANIVLMHAMDLFRASGVFNPEPSQA